MKTSSLKKQKSSKPDSSPFDVKPIPHRETAQPKPVALFVSDVHLQAGLPRTTQAFLDFLRQHAAHAEHLYLLGDLFEYWAGDDDISDDYHQKIVAALRALSDSGVGLHWIAGNRDFLVGEDFARATGASLLAAPSTIQLGEKIIVLVHGDAECTDDTGYMAFREKVRDSAWQQEFLRMPLAQRKAIIEGMRIGSKMEQKEKASAITDVNPAAITGLFLTSQAHVVIHGHTHRPAQHLHTEGIRYVLPDWDCDTSEPRGGWLSADADGHIVRHDWDGRPIPDQLRQDGAPASG